MSLNRIPYGIDSTNQHLVRATRADLKREYYCPGCKTALLVKRGPATKSHFAHVSGNQCESKALLKTTAKLLIVDSIKKWKNGGQSPTIIRICFSCFNRRKFQLLPNVEGAFEDVKLSNGKVADIVLTAMQIPVAAIQIAVDLSEEQNNLGRIIPWLELNAKEVISNPLIWDTLCESLGAFTCESCAQDEQQHDQANEERLKRKNNQGQDPKQLKVGNRRRRGRRNPPAGIQPGEEDKKERAMRKKKETEHRALKKLAHSLGVSLPLPPYSSKIFTCKGCDQEVVVHSWTTHKMCSQTDPPQPIPSSIQYRTVPFDAEMSWMEKPRFSSHRVADEYWANTCLKCQTVIKDEWLYSFEGPFGKEFYESRNRKSDSNGGGAAL